MSMEIRTGDLIDDRYRIIKLLGEGGMALVYEAFDMILKKNVAVKIIKEETMKNPLNLTRFEREARAASSLSSPNFMSSSLSSIIFSLFVFIIKNSKTNTSLYLYCT